MNLFLVSFTTERFRDDLCKILWLLLNTDEAGWAVSHYELIFNLRMNSRHSNVSDHEANPR